MFRKEPEVMAAWTPEKPGEMAAIQRDLILQAERMLKPGGLLLYSTCTFAPVENEAVISHLLERCPDMEILELPKAEGFSPGVPEWGNGDARLERCVRLWPHKLKGEGHFLCLLRKPGESVPAAAAGRTKLPKEGAKLLAEFFERIGGDFPLTRMEARGEKVYLLPEVEYPSRGIPFLRNGLYLGDLKKNRFEPSQQLAMALGAEDFPNVLRLDPGDTRMERYLRGETLNLEPGEAPEKGWCLVCAGDFPLGFGKVNGGVLKNKYAAGWRVKV